MTMPSLGQRGRGSAARTRLRRPTPYAEAGTPRGSGVYSRTQGIEGKSLT